MVRRTSDTRREVCDVGLDDLQFPVSSSPNYGGRKRLLGHLRGLSVPPIGARCLSEQSIIVWDLETVPDLAAAARMLDLENAPEAEVREARIAVS